MVVLKDQDGSNRAFGRLLRLPAFGSPNSGRSRHAFLG
jgi:hypothetical protein